MKMPALPRVALACQLLYYWFEDGLGKSSYREEILIKERKQQTLVGIAPYFIFERKKNKALKDGSTVQCVQDCMVHLPKKTLSEIELKTVLKLYVLRCDQASISNSHIFICAQFSAIDPDESLQLEGCYQKGCYQKRQNTNTHIPVGFWTMHGLRGSSHTQKCVSAPLTVISAYDYKTLLFQMQKLGNQCK